MKRIIARLLPIFRNKFYLTLIIFVAWLLFFDQYDIITQFKYRYELSKLREDKEYYEEEIKKVKADLEALSTDQQQMEKFAREKYLMKKKNEDIFVITD